jgi:RNA recognition motif. (a.k.a. RRM, RBD, or RNP domain)
MAKRLYVGNLPYSVRDQELGETFAPFGAVKHSRVVMEPETGRSRGFGFVEMEDDAAADAAIAELHGKPMGQRNLIVNEARPMTDRPAFGDRPPRPPREGGGGYGGPREGGGRYGGGGGGSFGAPRDGGGGFGAQRDGGGGSFGAPRDSGRRAAGGGGYGQRDGGGGGFSMPAGGDDTGWRSPYGRPRRQDRQERHERDDRDRRDKDFGDDE